MLTWNPPWLMALLIPFIWISFQQATWLWLILSIVSIFAASLLSWHIIANEWMRKRLKWISPAVAFVFVPTLIGLLAGQINHLVFLGLAVFLFFEDRKRPFIADMGLALTLFKPHLVYITLPILLLKALSERKWRIWFGLGSVVLLLTAIVLILRPTFLLDYGRSLQAGSLTNWQTPTLSGILAMQFGWTASKWMGTAVLPLMIGIWYRWRERFSYSVWLNSTLLVSIITAPFGWGYDAIVLLLPIFQMISWALMNRKYNNKFRLVIPFLIIIDGLLFYQRFAGTNEVYYFWLPIVISGLYFLTLAWQTSPQLGKNGKVF